MSAISGLDIALWDLKGRRLGVPVWSLLGGKVREKIQVYVSLIISRFSVSRVCVTHKSMEWLQSWVGGDRPSDIANAAKARKEAGYNYVKGSLRCL